MKTYTWEKKLRKKVTEILAKEVTGHDIYHAERVRVLAQKIAEEEKLNVDWELLIAGSWLHDVGYTKIDIKVDKPSQHLYRGIKIAKRVLPAVGFPVKKTKAVLYIIEHHDDYKVKVWDSWKDKEVIDEAWDELLVVRDADLIDSMGAIGVMRLFMYASVGHRHLLNRIPRNVFKKHDERAEEMSSPEVFYIHQFNALKSLNFNSSKKYAKKKLAFNRIYLKEVARELKELGFN